MNGRPRPAVFRFGRGAPRKKDHIPAQPFICEGADGARALDIGYENILITACRSYMFICMKTIARE